jgi:hypothetical protein
LGLVHRIRPELYRGDRQTPVQLAPARQRPPVVEENLQRSPICDPTKDEKTLFDQSRILDHVSSGKTRRDQACNEDRDTDRERAAADPEQLVEFVLDGNGAAGEIAMKCLVQLFGICVAIRDMDGDPDRTLVWQFSRSTDDVFFGILIEILFPERKRIERMKELREAVDADFDQMLRIFRCHSVMSPEMRPALHAAFCWTLE